MSQAAIKPTSRTSFSLSQQAAGVRKSSRPNTPQTALLTDSSSTKTDSRSSTPNVAIVEEIIIPKPISAKNSPKTRASPRASTEESSEKKTTQSETNGNHEKETNGTNGNYVAADKELEKMDVAKTDVAPKSQKQNNKKEKETSQKHASDDEMEPLVIVAETIQDTSATVELPQTPKTGKKPVRVLTPREAPPSGRAKGKPQPAATVITQERLQSTSTIVNLSTVSEQEVISPNVYESVQIPPSRISGRRSVRPIKDIQLTYRSSASFNESASSSLNATVGSNIHNETINTPYILKTGGFMSRKRRDGDLLEQDGFIDSPSKRARIDFSGFLGYVTTPVTLLKNRLSRVGLTSSTPRQLDVDEQEEVKIADVSGTETPATAASTAEEAKEMEIDNLKEAEKTTDADEQLEDSDISITEKKNRSFCVVM